MILEIKNLIKRYGDFLAVDNVSLSIKEGEILGLLGPNGAGKTTIINCIIGLNKIDSGSIKVFGEDLKENEINIKRQIGIVTQNISLYNDLNAYDNVMYFASIYGLKGKLIKESVDEVLNYVGLFEERKKFPDEFSGGMLRRLNIACGIVHHPRLVIMDEPTAGIDPQSRSRILDGVEKLAKAGTTIVYTSHYMEEIERICTDIAIIDQGRIIAHGNKEELKNIISAEEKVRIKVSALNYTIVEKIKSMYGVKECNLYENVIDIISTKGSKNLGKIIDVIVQSGIEIMDIDIQKPTIEDVFLTLTGRNLRN
ncbi:ABC-2 type transport system ATP-binding protein [Clostridium acidisoli DSM 12555]|uniref:ABC-2 type transport system ATP-binding protein n=1 Tax=Clostridium acidisoli DSM 12555 TaxID=1121291 RepID=A0A1W1XMX2_9CLOT|nr:ABC transporter ATP-binding protein [Clostridium acidisoli]SMC25340.1 ABC-2 type transport system ATP-binding protein [Clostridium acidisoli DSM 12555]